MTTGAIAGDLGHWFGHIESTICKLSTQTLSVKDRTGLVWSSTIGLQELIDRANERLTLQGRQLKKKQDEHLKTEEKRKQAMHHIQARKKQIDHARGVICTINRGIALLEKKVEEYRSDANLNKNKKVVGRVGQSLLVVGGVVGAVASCTIPIAGPAIGLGIAAGAGAGVAKVQGGVEKMERERRALEGQIENDREKIGQLERDIENKERSVTVLIDQVEKAAKQIAKLDEEIQAMWKMHVELQSSIDTSHVLLDDLNTIHRRLTSRCTNLGIRRGDPFTQLAQLRSIQSAGIWG